MRLVGCVLFFMLVTGTAVAQSLGENGLRIVPLKKTLASSGTCTAEVIDIQEVLLLCADDDACPVRLTFFHDNGTLYFSHGTLMIAADGISWRSAYSTEALGGDTRDGEIGDNQLTYMVNTEVGGCAVSEDGTSFNGVLRLHSCSAGSCTLRIDD